MKIIDVAKRYMMNGDNRTRKMRKNTIIMVIIRGLSMLISLAYVPMMLNAVNRVDYGVLLTLTSMVNWLSMLDVGLGSGLRNKLSAMLANNETDEAKRLVSSCYGALFIYVGAIAITFCIISGLFSWGAILNAPECDPTDLHRLVNVVFVAFCFQFYLNLITSVLYSFQLPAFNSIISLISQAVCFVIVYALINFCGIHNIFIIGSFTCLVPPIVILLTSFVLYSTKLRGVAPSVRLVDFKLVRSTLSLGLKFFLLQIISIIMFQANSIIIAQAVGPESVVEYNIAFKYISIITILFNFVIAPVWSASTEAYAKGETTWIAKTVRYLEKVWIFVMIGGLLLVFLSKPVYRIWLHAEIDIPYITTIMLLIYMGFNMLYQIYGTILNGIGKIYAQMIITSIIAIIYIPFAYYSGRHYGLVGVLIANSIIFAINYTWSFIQYRKVITGKAKGFWNKD